jgi:TLC domain
MIPVVAMSPSQKSPSFWHHQQHLVKCGAAVSVMAYLTLLQEDPCRIIIAVATVSYGILYALLCAAEASNMFPSLSSNDSAEAKSRILSTINAILLTFGSLLCFLEWPYQPVAEGWTASQLSQPALFASLFTSFLQWDLLWMLWQQYSDVSATVHHILFLFMTHYVLSGIYFNKPFAWLSLTELSTPFLNLRWWYAATKRKEGTGYLYASWAFAGTFGLTRVVGYLLGVLDMLRHYRYWSHVGGLHAVAVGIVLGYLLNLFWAVKIVQAVQRVMRKKTNDNNNNNNNNNNHNHNHNNNHGKAQKRA